MSRLTLASPVAEPNDASGYISQYDFRQALGANKVYKHARWSTLSWCIMMVPIKTLKVCTKNQRREQQVLFFCVLVENETHQPDRHCLPLGFSLGTLAPTPASISKK